MHKINCGQIAAMNIHYKYYPLTRFLDDTVRSHLSCVELWGAAPHFYPEDMDYHGIKKTRKEIEGRGLKLVCYTPEQCVYPINLAAENPETRRRSQKYFEDAIRIASDLGTDKVLVTSGTGYFDNSNQEDAWQHAIKHLSLLGEMAEEHGVTLVLEVLRRDESNLVYDLESLAKMLQAINLNSVCAMVDTIPMALANETPAMYLKEFGKKLRHVHFIDGAPRGHLAWGDGVLNMTQYLKELEEGGYSGSLSLEITDGRYFMEPWKALEQSAQQLFASLHDSETA